MTTKKAKNQVKTYVPLLIYADYDWNDRLHMFANQLEKDFNEWGKEHNATVECWWNMLDDGNQIEFTVTAPTSEKENIHNYLNNYPDVPDWLEFDLS